MSQKELGPTDREPLGIHETSRREKLRKIADMGIDPWGGRFDGRSYIGDIRARTDEIKLRKASGETIDLPRLDGPEPVDFRVWLQQQGPGELTGPQVVQRGESSCSATPANSALWTSRIGPARFSCSSASSRSGRKVLLWPATSIWVIWSASTANCGGPRRASDDLCRETALPL